MDAQLNSTTRPHSHAVIARGNRNEQHQESLTSTDALELIKLEYDFLPEQAALVSFARDRLTTLLYDCDRKEIPEIHVLAHRGMGINALAIPVGPSGAIVISPELLAELKTVEQLDAVLLHEYRHLAAQHVERQNIPLSSVDSVAEYYGLRRLGEHEADLWAFHAQCDPRRDSSPQGTISLLQLIGENTGSDWDVDHGTILNRLQLISGMLVAVEVNPSSNPVDHILFKEQRALPSAIKEAASELPKTKGKYTKFLTPLTQRRELSPEWTSQSKKMLQSAPLRVIEVVLPKLCRELQRYQGTAQLQNKRGTSVAKLQIDAIQRVISTAIDRYEELTTKLSKEEQTVGNIALCLTSSIGIPEMSEGETFEVPSAIGNLWQKTMTSITSEPNLIGSILENYEQRSPASLVELVWFGHKLAASEAFFDSEGELINDRIKAAFSAKKNSVQTASLALATGMMVGLEDCGFEQESILECFRNCGAQAPVKGWTSILDFRTQHEGKLHLGLSVVFASTEESGRKELKFIKTTAKVLSERLGSRSETEAQTVKNALFNSELTSKEFKEALRSLEDQPTAQSTIHSNALTLYIKAKTVEDAQRAILILQRTILSAVEYEMLLRERSGDVLQLILPSLESGGRDKDWRVVEELEPARFLNFKSNSKLKSSYRTVIIEELIGSLSKDFEPANNPPELFFARLQQIRSRFGVEAIRPGKSDDLEFFASDSQFIKVRDMGVDLLMNQPPDKRELVDLWTLTFLEPDPMVQDRLQRSLYEETMKDRNAFKQLSELAANKLSANLLGYLDSAARSPLELAALEQLVQRWWKGEEHPLARSVGSLVALEACFGRKELSPEEALSTGLGTRTDDSKLVHHLSNSTFALYQDLIKQEVRRVLSIDSVDSAVIQAKNFDESVSSAVFMIYGGKLFHTTHILSSIYGAEAEMRMAVIRELLTGSQGLLHSTTGRGALAETLLKVALDDTDSGTRKVFGDITNVLCQTVPAEDLSLLLCRVLEPHFLRPPKEAPDWGKVARNIAIDLTSETLPVARWCSEFETLREKLRNASKTGNPRWRVDELRLRYGSFFDEEILPAVKDPDRFIERWGAALADDDTNTLIRGLVPDFLGGMLSEDDNQDLWEWLDRICTAYIAHHTVLWFLQGEQKEATQASREVESPLTKLIPLSQQAPVRALPPVTLAVESGKSMGAPGVRMLQLFGQFFDLPPEYITEFETVYDGVRGQSKLAAWKTVKRYLPEYSDQLELFGHERLGGGSLYTVFKARLQDGSEEAVRVLNPNAAYRSRRTVEALRKASTALTRMSTDYQQSDGLVDLVGRWIEIELADSDFEQLDPVFREQWSGEDLYVPKIFPTGTVGVRREQFVDARSLGDVRATDPNRAKGVVGTIAANYLQQLRTPLPGIPTQPIVVHSDVTTGNFLVEEDGRAVILDRGNFLRFDPDEVSNFTEVFMEGDPSDKAERLFKIIEGHPDNHDLKMDSDDRDRLKSALIKLFQDSAFIRSPERVLHQFHRIGMHVPVKYALLARNLKVLLSWQE